MWLSKPSVTKACKFSLLISLRHDRTDGVTRLYAPPVPRRLWRVPAWHGDFSRTDSVRSGSGVTVDPADRVRGENRHRPRRSDGPRPFRDPKPNGFYARSGRRVTRQRYLPSTSGHRRPSRRRNERAKRCPIREMSPRPRVRLPDYHRAVKTSTNNKFGEFTNLMSLAYYVIRIFSIDNVFNNY